MDLVLNIRVQISECHRLGDEHPPLDVDAIRKDLTDQCVDMLHYQHKYGNEHLCVVERAEGI